MSICHLHYSTDVRFQYSCYYRKTRQWLVDIALHQELRNLQSYILSLLLLLNNNFWIICELHYSLSQQRGFFSSSHL